MSESKFLNVTYDINSQKEGNNTKDHKMAYEIKS